MRVLFVWLEVNFVKRLIFRGKNRFAVNLIDWGVLEIIYS